MKKNSLITLIIILGVVILAYFLIIKNNGVSEETAKCIGQKATLYIQLGCHACKIQTDMFGENSEYLNIVDCFYEKEKCIGIKYTPTWIINNEKYINVQSIEKLKELTKC